MHNPQLQPLETNPKTGEPFLRLRKHKNIILTPPRWTDAEDIVAPLNDPVVHDWLGGPPFPYTLENGSKFLQRIKPQVDMVLQELEEARYEETLKIVGVCPVRYIREVADDGSDVLVGDLGITRCPHGELMGPNGLDWENKTKREEENELLEVGDPNILWSPDFLIASHHGQGIMSDAFDTLMHEWWIPRMGVRKMWGSAFTGNDSSVKVLLKNGFKLKETSNNHILVKGKMRGLHILEWSNIV